MERSKESTAGPPKESARTVFTTSVIGLISANVLMPLDIVATGTKIELIKTRGKIQIKPAH